MRISQLNPGRICSAIRKRRQERRGTTALEFALVAPIFFLVLFTCIEFCRLNMIRSLTQDAAYFAARSAMVPGATAAEATEEANRILGFMGTEGATVTVNDGAALDEDSAEISVTVTVPLDENALLVPRFTGDMEFTSTATLRTERYDGYYDPFSD